MTGAPAHIDRRKALAAPAGWGALGLLSCLSLLPFEPNLLEEGVVTHIGQRLAHGENLYQDVLIFTGPLPFELLGVLFRIFGEDLRVGRIAVAVFHALMTATTFGFVRRSGGGLSAHVAAAAMAVAPIALFPLLSLFYYTTLALQLSVLATYAALRGLDSWRWALLSGVLVACVALCKQTVGVVLAPGLGIAVWAGSQAPHRWRPLLAYLGGGALATAATLAGFAITGGLGAAIEALVWLPLSFEETYTAPFINFWPPGVLAPEIRSSQAMYLPYYFILSQGVFALPGPEIVLPTQLMYAAPLAAAALTPVRRVLGPLPSGCWLQLALLIAWISNLFPRTDWGHLVHVLPCAATQIALLASGFARSEARTRVAARVAAPAGIALMVIPTAGAWLYINAVADPLPLARRIPVRAVSHGYRGESIRGAIRYLEQNLEPDDALFVARAEPLLYFATGARNPTPYPGIIPGMREEQERVILEALEDTRYVVMSDVDQPAMTFYRDELPGVQAYLERHFTIPPDYFGGRVDWVVVLERGPDRGETAVDLIERRAEAHSWIRGRQGDVQDSEPVTDRVSTKYNRRPLVFEVGPGGGGLDYELDVPEGAVFQTDVGLWVLNGQERMYPHVRHSYIRISVIHDDQWEPVAAEPVMWGKAKWWKWTPMEVDLSAYAGDRIALRIELVPRQILIDAYGDRMYGFVASPRIALRAPAGEPAALE